MNYINFSIDVKLVSLFIYFVSKILIILFLINVFVSSEQESKYQMTKIVAAEKVFTPVTDVWPVHGAG